MLRSAAAINCTVVALGWGAVGRELDLLWLPSDVGRCRRSPRRPERGSTPPAVTNGR